MFNQILVPEHNLGITVLLALVPLIVLLCLLAVFRVTAWLSTLVASIVTVLMAVWVWGAPFSKTAQSYIYGSLQGCWSINWITLWGVVIFNTLVVTGNFDRFQKWMVRHATADIRIQTIMLAWAFGALLEGLVGFGYPWAVVVPILVGLGIADLEAIRVAALANNAPVSYGALGAPILALATVTGMPLLDLSASVGHIVSILAILPPWVLLYLVSGKKGMLEAWPLALIGSGGYVLGQWPVARYLGPYLPDITGALVCFWILFFFIKKWRPKIYRGFGGQPLEQSAIENAQAGELLTHRQAFFAWLPFLILLVVVVAWTGPWSQITKVSWAKWQVSAVSSITHKPQSSAFNFTPWIGGSSILASWLVILLILRPKLSTLRDVFARTLHQMWGAFLVGFFIFGLAYVFVFSGMANSLAYGFSKIGWWFIVLAPVLGWIGVALSGSNTSTNAMFGSVQAATGHLLYFPPFMLPSLNSVGAEVGKPIAPQTASVGVSTSKLVRSEGEVIRHNMSWTLIMLAYLIGIGLLFYFLFPGVMEKR